MVNILTDKSDDRQKLDEMQQLLIKNKELNKAYFGLLFWQLHEVSEYTSEAELFSQAATLTLSEPDDESLASLVSLVLQLWDSASDFNAACRFIVSCLDMSADELLQTRAIYLKRKKSQASADDH